MKEHWPLDVSVSFDPYYGEPNRDGEQGAEVLPDGRVHFRVIAKDAPTHLKKGGILMLEIGYDQKSDVIDLLQRPRCFSDIRCLPDLTGKDRVIYAR